LSLVEPWPDGQETVINVTQVGYVAAMSFDPRPRYLLAGALFIVAAIITLFAGSAIVALLLALVAAGLFYSASRVTTVP